jgi:integrase
MPSITKILVEKAQPKQADYTIWDNRLTGFGLKVTPKGKRVYLLKYRAKDGTQRKPTIGEHSEALTCENARDIAKDWLAIVQQGGDPSGERQGLRQSSTVAELCDRYMREHARVYKKPSSIELDEYYVERFIKPRLGTAKVVSLTRQEVIKFHQSMLQTPVQANRLLNSLSKMFSLAEEWEIRPVGSNPCRKVPRFKETPKDRFLTDEEMESLGDTLRALEKAKAESPYMIALLRILIMTGARLGEILGARWEWVDMQRGVLTLPDSKVGRRIIKLGGALAVLETLPRVKGNPYIIAGEVEGKPMVKPERQWRRIRDKAGLKGVRLHDLRHTYASVLAMQGESMVVVAKLLGHKQLRTTERYAHLGNNPLESAVKRAGDMIGAKVLGR